MARDQSVRNRIVAYLAEQGPVEDSSGKATSVLKQAIAYEGTDAGFTQVVAAMAKAGLLTRQIRGKRTYRISQQRQAATATATVPCGVWLPGRAHQVKASSTTTSSLPRCSPRRRVLASAPSRYLGVGFVGAAPFGTTRSSQHVVVA